MFRNQKKILINVLIDILFQEKKPEIFEEVVNIFGGSNMSYFKNGDFSLDAYFLFHFQLVQTILKRSLMDRPSYCDRQGTVL